MCSFVCVCVCKCVCVSKRVLPAPFAGCRLPGEHAGAEHGARKRARTSFLSCVCIRVGEDHDDVLSCCSCRRAPFRRPLPLRVQPSPLSPCASSRLYCTHSRCVRRGGVPQLCYLVVVVCSRPSTHACVSACVRRSARASSPSLPSTGFWCFSCRCFLPVAHSLPRRHPPPTTVAGGLHTHAPTTPQARLAHHRSAFLVLLPARPTLSPTPPELTERLRERRGVPQRR